MMNEKDISQNLKDNQHKLNKKPSDKAWGKLEAQLDDFQPKAKRRKLIAKWSIAASILAIVGIGAFVSNNLNTDNNQTAMVVNKMTFEVLSHVKISESKKSVEESYRSAQKDVKIIEGPIAKKLVPSPEIVKTAEVINEPTAVSAPIVATSTSSTIAQSGATTSQINTDIAFEVESDAIAMQDDDISVESSQNDAKVKATSTQKRNAELSKDAITAKARKKSESKKTIPAPAKKAKSSYLMSSSLTDFKWIMGDWREIAGGNSSWNLAGDNLLKNEEFKISLVSDKVYLDAPFEDFKGRYTLVSKSNSQFVFVRNGVVITIKKNGNGFDVVLNDHGYEQMTMRSYMK